ncbi:type II secretion system secretin GspD [Roseateles sp. BYS180W]|uniref:Type II secretion system secretin GspD n=1 Tax=Roseateles rivi TaxID=3299028 RepID=A0ABW7FRD5_9BURK
MSTRRKLLGRRVMALTLSLTTLTQPLWVQAAPAAKDTQWRNPVTLNFVNTDIEAVTRAISAMINRNILVDPRVKGTLTLNNEQPLTVREAYLNYLAALRGLGFTAVEVGGLIKIVPEADAKLQTGSVSVGDASARGDQVVTQIFKLTHENANNLVGVLRPLISPNNMINANPGNNSLVITDYADNLQRIARIIAAMDTAASTDIEVLQLKHAVASDIAPLLQRLLDAAPAGPGMAPTPSGVTVMPDPRSNALILRASNAAKLASARAMVSKLDQPASEPGQSIRVVYLRNADATKLATVLRAAFAAQSSGQGGGASSSGGLSAASPLTQPSSTAAQNSGATGGMSAAATAPLAPSPSPSTGGFIQADPSTNSLIITAAEPLYRQIRGVIDQLDTRRAQIYVESMIVKVDASKVAQFGVQWQNLWGQKGDATLVGAGTNFGGGANNIVTLGAAVTQGRSGIKEALAAGISTGFNIGVLRKISDFYTLGAIAQMLEQQTGANILSTPNLIALDNEEAKIVIGQNVPFITGSYSSTGGGSGNNLANPFQTIERKDVGLTLKVRSQVGEGGTVRMTVYQENSSVVPGATTTAGPTTDKSAIETTVVVDDGQIMVLGGLLKDEYTDGEDKVPGLGSIPLLGHLFKSENRKRIKTNLMVFLRPVVIRDQAGADQLTLDRYDTIRAFQGQAQPKSSLVLPDTGAPQLPEQPAPTPLSPRTEPKAAPGGAAPSSAAPASAPPPKSNPGSAAAPEQGLMLRLSNSVDGDALATRTRTASR